MYITKKGLTKFVIASVVLNLIPFGVALLSTLSTSKNLDLIFFTATVGCMGTGFTFGLIAMYNISVVDGYNQGDLLLVHKHFDPKVTRLGTGLLSGSQLKVIAELKDGTFLVGYYINEEEIQFEVPASTLYLHCIALNK